MGTPNPKTLNILLLLFGMSIFATTVFMHIDAWERKSKSEMQLLSSTLDWEDHLYTQALRKSKDNK